LTRAFLLLFAGAYFGAYASAQPISLAEFAERALAQSQLTRAGSTPFHLTAHVEEKNHPSADIKGDIEVYWLAPNKWRRTIKSRDFSQTTIVNGEKRFEKNEGDYYPAWLRTIGMAIANPIPMMDMFSKSSAAVSTTGDQHSCARLVAKTGTPPRENSLYYLVCFDNKGLVEAVFTPSFAVEYRDYKEFRGKQVARQLVHSPEPGTDIVGEITSLEELTNPNELLFSVPESTPKEKVIRNVAVPEETLWKMVRGASGGTPEIAWPAVREGRAAGVLSMYVWIDRTGRVREMHPLSADNPALEDPVREQVKKWQFTPGDMGGSPVQVEGVLTFAFSVGIENPIVILTDEEGRKLATNQVEPAFPAKSGAEGSSITIRIRVDEHGKLTATENPAHLAAQFFIPADKAVSQWQFKPYMKNGKPDIFKADITFKIPQ